MRLIIDKYKVKQGSRVTAAFNRLLKTDRVNVRSNPVPNSSIETGAVTVPIGAPFSKIPPFMDEERALAELNPRLFKAAHWGSGPGYGLFLPNGGIARLRRDEAQVLLADYTVNSPVTLAGSVIMQPRPAWNWWEANPQKTRYDTVLYDPENRFAQPNECVLNTWRGLAPEKKGSWRLMRRHIWKVLCRTNRVWFKYFIHWLAHCVQYPGTNPEVMVVLRSDYQGVGKSIVGNWMLNILGPHGYEATKWKSVLGDFTTDLENKSFVLLEEPKFPGYHQATEELLAFITGKTVWINTKRVPAYSVPHTLHLMMTTNATWAIQAGPNSRRLFILDADNTNADNPAYFNPLIAEAENGGIAAMLYDLRRVKLRGADIRRPPVTTALIEQQRRSADDVMQWFYDCIIRGFVIYGAPQGGFDTAWPIRELHNSYLGWCHTQNRKHTKTAHEFGMRLGKLKIQRNPGNNPPQWNIPTDDKLLAAIEAGAGIKARRK